MSVAKGSNKVVYPAGCKELSDELGKDELVRRLKLLARAFQDMGQDDNIEEYSGLAISLATDFYMDHQSKDVRLLVACCIADVFRIFAPEAPFRETSLLKEIFMFFIKQLRGLEDPDSPTFKRYFYLLENLAWVKSFNICIELDDNQEIFCNLFQLMFSIINEKHSSKVRNFVLDMMTPLITEADAVSQELLDIILLNIIEPYKTQNRVAYNMARDLLIRTSNAIEPYIQAFFNNALMLGKMSESEVSDRLYELIYELNHISPSVLLAVLPQLEFKLKSNEESERKAVTKLLAKMFSDQGSNLAEQNRPLWNCFLGRFNDISIHVRQTCVSYAQHFILNHQETYKDIVEQLKIRQHDPEETVRMEVVNTILSLAKKDFNSITDELMGFIKERTLDKKYQIRRDSLLGLGQLYKKYTFSERVDKANQEKVCWVKDKVFHAYYQNSNEDRLLVERVFNTCLVPYNSPVDEKMRRLLLMYCTLDDHAVKAFNEMLKHKNTVKNLVHQLVDSFEQQQGQGNVPSFNPRIAALARSLPESGKSSDHLKKLCQMLKEDKRMRQYMKLLVGEDCTCKRAQELVREVLKKLGSPAPGQQNQFYNTVKLLLERVAPVMIDASSINMLVKHVDETVRGLGIITEGIEDAAEKGVRLLTALSTVYPYYFKDEETYQELLTFLKHEDEAVSDLTLQIFINTGRKLQAELPVIYSSLLPILQSTAKLGNPKQSKHALRCINIVCKNKELIFGQIFEHLKKSLNPESANYLTSIVALGHIALYCPEEFSAEMKNIVSKVIVKELLMQDHTSGPDSVESWYSEHHVTEETMAKVQAMKLLVRWLQGIKSNANNSGTSTLRLLFTVIKHEGDLMERGKVNKPELARLRLQAGCCMLKLAEDRCYSELISQDQFQTLALLMNDSCYHVRLNFALKLHKGLLSLKLPLEYMSIFCLAANDPLRERRAQVKIFYQQNINKRREYLKQTPAIKGRMFHFMPDYVIPYVIHLLAHDPDLPTHDDVTALKNIKECLSFVMEPLINKSEDYNYNFFRRMLENIKQTKDAEDPDDEDMNRKLYSVCDVALGILNSKPSNITLKDSTVEPVLPAKLFTRPDKSYSNTKSYLPKEFVIDGPKRKGQTNKGPSAQEIIVESPGPVVNPLPVCPREPKRKKKATTTQAQTMSDSENDSGGEEEVMFKPVPDGPKKRGPKKKDKATQDVYVKPKPRGRPPKSVDSPAKRGRKPKQVEDSGESDKITDSSPDVKSFSSSQDSNSPKPKALMESKRGNTQQSKTKKKKVSQESASSSPASSPRRSSSESPRRGNVDSKSVNKSSIVNGTNKGGAKRTVKSDSEGSGNRKRKAVDTSTERPPVKRGRPPSNKAGKALTRSKLKGESDADSDVGSPNRATKQLKMDQFSTKTAPKNVRRAKVLANGTSDGDSPETDGSSSPSKLDTLSRMIQTVGTEEESGVKRRVRGKRK
ncbi:sister chromatid cohesion protein PDS5 homolog A-like [Argopecten irradians]|uniref:sister chromatid cohesion protein PDS5 homolog A-like n=1 Tax=Argopecten irradians TaxID=31199 RepID=UPI00371193E0